jgi:DNA-binding PadR family transcriptional regulator
MDRTSLYRAITPMQREGWVKVSAGTDGRARTAEFTAKGRRLLKAADPDWGRTQTAVVERFGRDKWAALVSELERLRACASAVAAAYTDDPTL